jgi:hypothetical protein
LTGARFNFSDYFQLGWKLCQIGCACGVAIARGAWEGRDVAIGDDGIGEHSCGGVEKSHRFTGS